MHIIRDHLHHWNLGLHCFTLPADRLTLAKRRWRGAALDGTEFGFDLEHPLADGDVFFQNEVAVYQVAQQPEAVLEVSVDSATNAAQTGWKIGNLHFPIAVLTDTILAPDDPAIRQMLEREHISYRSAQAVFRPLHGAHTHGNHVH